VPVAGAESLARRLQPERAELPGAEREWVRGRLVALTKPIALAQVGRHTHSRGTAVIHSNLPVLTGKADYGNPEIHRLLVVE
jgi:hypothetical protein